MGMQKIKVLRTIQRPVMMTKMRVRMRRMR